MTSDSSPEIDPKKLFETAPAVLNQLAKLTEAVIQSRAKYHVAPEVMREAGNAVILIMKLRKDNVLDTTVKGA